MEASLRLYRDLLGGTIIRNFKSEDGAVRIVYIQLAEGVVELILGKPNEDGSNMGLQHIAFLTAFDTDIHQAVQTVRDAGYKITVEPKPGRSAPGMMAFFQDKGGCTYELLQREEDIRIPGLKNERITEINHLSIRVDDETAEDTKNLLTNILGLKPDRHLQIGDADWRSYRIGPDSIGLFNTKDKPRPEKTLALIVFNVTDVFEMHKHLTESGIEGTEPRAAGIGDFHIIFATGPDGERLEFLDRK